MVITQSAIAISDVAIKRIRKVACEGIGVNFLNTITHINRRHGASQSGYCGKCVLVYDWPVWFWWRKFQRMLADVTRSVDKLRFRAARGEGQLVYALEITTKLSNHSLCPHDSSLLKPSPLKRMILHKLL